MPNEDTDERDSMLAEIESLEAQLRFAVAGDFAIADQVTALEVRLVSLRAQNESATE